MYMIVNEVCEIVSMSFDKDTCYPVWSDKWNSDMKCLGQGAVAALVLNDFLGGKIMRCESEYGSHYYNLINDKIVDLTVSQFKTLPNYETGIERTREYLLSNEDTKNRYKKLLYNLKQSTRKVQGKKFKLINEFEQEYLSDTPGLLGGHKKLKIYGRLDCPSANRWIEKGNYIKYRVFFSEEEIAIKAGYRPCAICMPNEYKKWKNSQKEKKLTLDKE